MIEILDRIAKQKVEKSFDFLHSINNTGFEKAFRDIIDEDFILWVYTLVKHDNLFRLEILFTIKIFVFDRIGQYVKRESPVGGFRTPHVNVVVYLLYFDRVYTLLIRC